MKKSPKQHFCDWRSGRLKNQVFGNSQTQVPLVILWGITTCATIIRSFFLLKSWIILWIIMTLMMIILKEKKKQ